MSIEDDHLTTLLVFFPKHTTLFVCSGRHKGRMGKTSFGSWFQVIVCHAAEGKAKWHGLGGKVVMYNRPGSKDS